MRCLLSITILLLVRKGAAFNPAHSTASAVKGRDFFRVMPALQPSLRSALRTSICVSPSEEASGESMDKFSRTSLILSTTFNLVKTIAGSGILALPSGIAATSDFKDRYVESALPLRLYDRRPNSLHITARLAPALAIMVGLGAISAYTFILYGRSLNVHKSHSLGELWKKEKGERSSWMISMTTMTFCFGGALSYSILLADTFEALAHTLSLRGMCLSRSFWILTLTPTLLYPLCNLQSLLSLAPLSVAGVAAVATTTCFLGWRCPSFNPRSPYSAAGGALIGTLSSNLAPTFNTYNKPLFSPSSAILIGMAASAYLGHFSAPSFYGSLKPKSEKSNSSSSQEMVNYNIVAALGFTSAALLNCLVMAFGFLTFGGSSSGLILNNFSLQDLGASVCRLLMVVCVLGGYPFLVSGVVEEFLQLRGKHKTRQTSREARKNATTCTLFLLTALSLVMEDAGFVIGFSGAVMGSFIVYVFPALLFLSHSKKIPKLSHPRRAQTIERIFCRFLVGFGAIVAVLGGFVSAISTFSPKLLR